MPGAVEVELDDDVGFLGGALNARAATGGHDAPNGWASSVAARSARWPKGTRRSRRPGRSWPAGSRDADVADQDAVVEVTLPGAGRIGEPPEQHEVGVAGNDPKTHAAQRRCDPVPLGDQRRDAAQRVVGVPQRGPGGGLGDDGQVVGQPHQQHRVDHRRAWRPGSPAGRRRRRTPCSSCGSRPVWSGTPPISADRAGLRRRTRRRPRRRSRSRAPHPAAGAGRAAKRSARSGCWGW